MSKRRTHWQTLKAGWIFPACKTYSSVGLDLTKVWTQVTCQTCRRVGEVDRVPDKAFVYALRHNRLGGNNYLSVHKGHGITGLPSALFFGTKEDAEGWLKYKSDYHIVSFVVEEVR